MHAGHDQAMNDHEDSLMDLFLHPMSVNIQINLKQCVVFSDVKEAGFCFQL